MKKTYWIYALSIGILDAAIILSLIFVTVMNFKSISLPVTLFLLFICYILLEYRFCSPYEQRTLPFAAIVIGGSLISMLLILFLCASFTRNFDTLLGVDWVGLFCAYAYASVIGLRLFWQLICVVKNRF